jgi:hypothetical protein
MTRPIELLSASEARMVVRAVARRVEQGRDVETWDLDLVSVRQNVPMASNAFRVERPPGAVSTLSSMDQYVQHALGQAGLERRGPWAVVDSHTLVARSVPAKSDLTAMNPAC